MRGVVLANQRRGLARVQLLVLAVLLIILWHLGNDRLIGLRFGVDFSPDPSLLELTDFRCENSSAHGPGTARGTVRNVSDQVLPLYAQVMVKTPGFSPLNIMDTVRPTPLMPGQSGTFEIDTPSINAGDRCAIVFFGVSGGGRLLAFRDLRRR